MTFLTSLGSSEKDRRRPGEHHEKSKDLGRRLHFGSVDRSTAHIHALPGDSSDAKEPSTTREVTLHQVPIEIGNSMLMRGVLQMRSSAGTEAN